MKLRELKESLTVSDKYQVDKVLGHTVHTGGNTSISKLYRKDIKNPRTFYLKGYNVLKDGDAYNTDNLIDEDKYPFGKIAGFIEYAAFKIIKYLGMNVPKSFNIHFDLKKDRHQLLVSSFKNGTTFGDAGLIGSAHYEKIRNSNFIYALFLGNSDFHGGNVAVKLKNKRVSDYYFFDLELAFRSISDNTEQFEYYLKLVDKIPSKIIRPQMKHIKEIDLKEINHIIDIAREHALLVVEGSIPTGHKFKKAIINKWDALLREISKKIKDNLRKNKKFLMEKYL